MIVSYRQHGGYLLILTLIFGAVFLTMLAAFMGFVINQQQIHESRAHAARALTVAESGLNYYKWYLAHNPEDLTNGTGEPGPYEYPYFDPEGGLVGTSTLDISGNTSCGYISSVDITSTGSVVEDPSVTRTVRARYARPTVASYAYIINANVWAGADRTIIGPYHSNGVIRMDGTNNSVVMSGQESWECDGSLPCDPGNPGDTVDGVYGDGPNSDLWVYPQPPVNFTSITVDLATIADRAENGGGIAIGPSGEYGYRLRFNGDGTFTLYSVDRVFFYYGYTSDDGWEYESNVIRDDDYEATYTIPEECPVIYIEDTVWLEGELTERVTLAAADIDTTGVDPSIVLNNNITYENEAAGLLAIAENDVIVGLVVPDEMEVSGIFIAQNGRFGRNHYCTSCWGGWFSYYGLPWYLDEYVTRDSLIIYGSVVSNRRVGTKWANQFGTFISGFRERENSYDRDLVANPPPFTPETSATYDFIEWRQD